MRWQWPARIIVAVIGLGAAVAIFVSTHGRPRSADPVTTLRDINPNVVSKGGAGKELFLKAGKNPITVTSNGSEEDVNGHRFLTGVLVEGLESDRFSVKGDRLDLEGPEDGPTTFNVTGHVVITTSDGLRLETDKARYDNTIGKMAMPGAVTFLKGRLSGSGMGATYDRDSDTFTLLDAAKARIEPDTTGHGSADATATRMTLARGKHILDLDGNARIVGDSQVLTGATATVTFTDDEHAIKDLDLRGAARTVPRTGAPGAVDQPQMAADTIAMSFRPDGITLQHASLTGQASLVLAGADSRAIHAAWIDLVMAPDGKTLTGLKANDHVTVELAATATSRARTITAASLVASGDDTKGLTSARFEGAPVFTETPDPPRAGGAAAPGGPLRGSGTVLVLTLAGQLDAIERADFLQNAQFQSGEAKAHGDNAKYDQAHDVVHFSPNDREPRKKSRVETPDITVDAWSIDLYTVTQDLTATDSVTTQSQSQAPPAGASAAALFDASKPILGAAERLDYTKSDGDGVAKYQGGKAQAKLWQETSRIQADKITYTDATRNLQASGHVDSTWLLDSTPAPAPAPAGGAKPDLKPYIVQAETLVYDDASRVATFKAQEVTLTTSDGGEIRAAVIVLRLAAASQALDELRAERNVWAKLSGDYEAVSSTLVYHTDTDIYLLDGKADSLAQVKAPEHDAAKPDAPATMCDFTTGLRIEINRKTNKVEQPGVSQGLRKTVAQACSIPLRRGGK